MKFNKEKSKSLHLGRKWSLQQYRLETDAWGEALQKRPLETATWDSSTLAAKSTRNILGCVTEQDTEGIITLHSSRWMMMHAGILCQVLGPRYKTEMDKSDQVQQKAAKMFGSWSHCPVRRGWGSWDYSAWSRAASRGSKHQSFSIWRYGQTSQPWGGSVKDTRQKAETIKVQISIKRNFYTIRRQSDSATHCPGSTLPFWRIFKTQPDKEQVVWSHSWPCFEQEPGLSCLTGDWTELWGKCPL